MLGGDPSSSEFVLAGVRQDQKLAEELIVSSQRERALSLLKQIDKVVAELEGALEWANQSLLLARAYALNNDQVAEHLFTEATDRMEKSPGCTPEHRVSVQNSFGKYLFGLKRFKEALKKYEVAEDIAIALGPSEVGAQVSLRIIHTKFLIKKDRNSIKNFETFTKVAGELSCTFIHRLAAWMKHEQSLSELAGEALFMRDSGVLSEHYFKQLLRETRESYIEE